MKELKKMIASMNLEVDAFNKDNTILVKGNTYHLNSKDEIVVGDAVYNPEGDYFMIVDEEDDLDIVNYTFYKISMGK